MDTFLFVRIGLWALAFLAFCWCLLATRKDIGQAGCFTWLPVAGAFAAFAAGILWGHLWQLVIAPIVLVPLIVVSIVSMSKRRSIESAPVVREYTVGDYRYTQYFVTWLVGDTAVKFWRRLAICCSLLLLGLVLTSFVDLVRGLLLLVNGEAEVRGLEEQLRRAKECGFGGRL